MSEKTKRISLSVLLAAVSAVLLSVYKNMEYVNTRTDVTITAYIPKVFGSWYTYLFLVVFFVIFMFFMKYKQIGEFIYKYRFAIAAGLFLICVIIGISGSSIGQWCNQFKVKDTGIILGASRVIRSDEWALGTPMDIAQKLAGSGAQGYFGDAINGCTIDNYLGYRVPVMNIVSIFRPFTLGFLFLPIKNAIAFEWSGKMILLLIVSFEFGMLITKKRKGLSILYMLLTAFAPAVQWWFSASMPVLIITTELSILLLIKYMNINCTWKRVLLLLGICLCAGNFIMTLYPSWMIPMAYVILALAIWVIIENHKNCKMKLIDWAFIVLIAAGFAASILLIIKKSSLAMDATMNTVYPGSRSETGGQSASYLSYYLVNSWNGLLSDNVLGNSCESATFFGLFPLCYVIPIYAMIHNKKKDILSIILMVVSAFFSIWCIFGFPSVLAKITLMSNSQTSRTVVILTFCNVILLIRGITLMNFDVKRLTAAITGITLSGIVNLICFKSRIWDMCVKAHGRTFSMLLVAGSFILFTVLFYLILRAYNKIARYVMYFAFAVLVFVSGVVVNPVRIGVKSVYELEWLQEISKVQKEDPDALWTMDYEFLPYTNMPLLTGAKTITATAIYPELERWNSIDPDKQYEGIYNRYAHISTILADKDKAEFTIGGAQDTFIVYCNLDDINKLGVKYITSRRDLEKFETENCGLTQINDNSKYRIYRIDKLN